VIALLLPALVVLGSFTTAGLLRGSFYVLLAFPIAAVLGMVVDAFLRDTDPAKEARPAPARPRERRVVALP